MTKSISFLNLVLSFSSSPTSGKKSDVPRYKNIPPDTAGKVAIFSCAFPRKKKVKRAPGKVARAENKLATKVLCLVQPWAGYTPKSAISYGVSCKNAG